jgi:hypothetical protein
MRGEIIGEGDGILALGCEHDAGAVSDKQSHVVVATPGGGFIDGARARPKRRCVPAPGLHSGETTRHSVVWRSPTIRATALTGMAETVVEPGFWFVCTYVVSEGCRRGLQDGRAQGWISC